MLDSVEFVSILCAACISHFVLDTCPPASKDKHFFSSSDSEEDEDSKKKFKIKIKPLVSDSAKCVPPSMDELKASVGGLALSPSLVSTADLIQLRLDEVWGPMRYMYI